MTPPPTGQLQHTGSGIDLILTPSFRASIDDVWASITEPDRTARWFARWTGDAALGKTIRYTMVFEAGSPEGDMTIESCNAPSHLAVATTDDYGTWRLEARLAEAHGVTLLTLVQHLEYYASLT